ncbi:MAG: helicase-related protein [Methanothrix sp.]|nr:helicase-related protein [Methanothrix sp.]
MALIDNKEKTMLQALKNALSTADRVDIEVGFFYFSGFEMLAEDLKDKHVRILVGKYIDPTCIPDIVLMQKSQENFDLEPYMPRRPVVSYSQKKEIYSKGFVDFVNKTSLFDKRDSQKGLKTFINKLEDGSLEIKISPNTEHGKIYITHNKKEVAQGGDYPGTVIIGSSNFTYQGLQGQGELNKDSRDKADYAEACAKFNKLWEDSDNIDVATALDDKSFVKDLKSDLWLYANPSPYHVYIRVLHELFGQDEKVDIRTPKQITNGDFSDLEYQLDAIKIGMDRLAKYDGAIIADVVGLGKSIIASAIANNLQMATIIIAPPHLNDQWEEYQQYFKIPGARVFSTGKIDEVYRIYSETREPLLIIIDEAHRFRNEDTNDYKLLHQICRSNPNNKILILTATPFNNDPKDVFALVKLFQTPGQSTIKSVDNLSLRFRELIDRYKKLRTHMRKNSSDKEYISGESEGIARELRRLIEPVVIRRSRIDIKTITRYREDLERQGIDFSEVIGPELMDYNLGSLSELYTRTLEKITADDGFIGARYKPAAYIKEGKREEFIKQLGNDMDETDLKTAQTNLSKFMRRLLVTRFESSKAAFNNTLEKMIESNKLIERWWEEIGKIPIQKKGQIPDPENIILDDSDNIEEQMDAESADSEIEKMRSASGLVTINNDLIEDGYINEVKADIKLLQNIKEEWFGNSSSTKDFDPKIDGLIKKINEKLSEKPDRKIVIFSAYADTVEYLFNEMKKRGVKRLFHYTAAYSSTQNKEIIRTNFDAGLPDYKQKNDYDVLIATDALSEGYNLHRAGIIINYDIPYNPTRVIQRIGRINRINKKVFDNLYIYNFFPTEVGESEIRVKQISTLKINLINNLIGSDTRTLTPDEDLSTFFKDEYKKEEGKQEQKNWDADHREAYDVAKRDDKLIDEISKIQPRSRVIRENRKENSVIGFGKKGDHVIFAIKNQIEEEPKIVGSETIVPLFQADPDEKGKPADEQYDKLFEIVRDALFAKNPLPKIAGRRADAIAFLKYLGENLPSARNYCKDVEDIIRKYDDISDGSLKDIAKINTKDPEASLQKLKEIIPEHQINVINERVERLESESEEIVLSEELRS